MGLESFQTRAHDILATESPSDVSTSADGSLEQNEDNVCESHEGATNHPTSSLLPPLTQDEAAVFDHFSSMVQAHSIHHNTLKLSPQNMPQYRNAFNERARRGFCYWMVEKKGSTCKGYSFGAYKTSLGLPKV